VDSGTYCPNCGEIQQAKAKYCDRCGSPIEGEPPSKPAGKMTEQEIEMLLQTRKEKDLFLKHHPQSPIPQDVRGQFKGLNYFPVNPSYRFLCRLNRYRKPAFVRMMTSTGEERNYLKVGYVRFTIEGEAQTLQAYKATHEHNHKGERENLFIPFKDATSGKETYGTARYLEIEEAEDCVFLVDFNKAYNPYCAYSEAYSCPFPPVENWLEVAVKAGEKKFKD